MQTYYIQSLFFSLSHDSDYLVKVHESAVVYLTVTFCIAEKLGIYQRACIDYHIGIAYEPLSANSNKVRRTAACSHKINHFLPPI